MHFTIPFTVVIHNYTTAPVIFARTEEEADSLIPVVYRDNSGEDSGKLEVKIDGNRILFKGMNADGEEAWLEAEKAKD